MVSDTIYIRLQIWAHAFHMSFIVTIMSEISFLKVLEALKYLNSQQLQLNWMTC